MLFIVTLVVIMDKESYEVIEFVQPIENEKNLLVTNISGDFEDEVNVHVRPSMIQSDSKNSTQLLKSQLSNVYMLVYE